MAAECGKRNCVCMYKNLWEAAVQETFSCVRESRNAHNRYAMAVEKMAQSLDTCPGRSHVLALYC